MGKACVIGRAYRVGRRMVTLRERPVAEIERRLVDVDYTVAMELGHKPIRCRALLAGMLADWREALWELTQDKADRLGVDPTYGKIIASSVYRMLGTTCGSPEFLDTCGALDSTDAYFGPNEERIGIGHFSGFAADVPTRYTRESFYPVVTISECWRLAADVGLYRPFRSEYWHWRPRKPAITAAYLRGE